MNDTSPPRVARVLIQPAAGETGPLDYSFTEELAAEIAVGVRVIVPLGQRRAVGIVTELAQHSPYPRLRSVLSVLDSRPVLGSDLLELCGWISEYYLASFGETVTAALPGSVRMRMERVARVAVADQRDDTAPAEPEAKPTRLAPAQAELLAHLESAGEQPVRALEQKFGKAVRNTLAALRRRRLVEVEHQLHSASGRTKHRRFFRAARALGAAEADEWMRRRPASYKVYAYLHEHPLGRATLTELDGTFPAVSAKLHKLQRAGLVATIQEELLRPVLPEQPAIDRAVTLSQSQQDAVQAVVGAMARGFAPFLLWGVTGSGKTEVYLRAIATALEGGQTALVLVPEISLTHQIVDRLRARFGDAGIAVLHSALSDGERWDEWRRIAGGRVRIVVGARSAVFAPTAKLGLIIVDEEHDSAYKQEDGVRYNGRDVAVMRAKLAGCPIVLGSATPALESYVNARSGRYKLLHLPERVESRPLPAIELVDLRRAGPMARAALVSPALRTALSANLTAGRQSLVFLNRRGFANFLQCHQCGTALQCPNCSVSLTLHQRWQALRCHHCDHTIPVPSACPGCGGMALGVWGTGTEQVEQALKKMIPGARVARMDRDTTSRKGSQRAILTAWERGESDILVGTQMIAKGHDVHGVTLVGVLLADSALNFPDFRAAERTFQLLAQVAGRAGRGTQPGRVIIQTFEPTHPSLRFAVHHDYQAFATHELAQRREHAYPPYGRLVQIRCEGEKPEATQRIVAEIKEALRDVPAGVTVLGPSPAPLEKVRRRYRWQLLLRGNNGSDLRRAARAARDGIKLRARKVEVRVIVDVDPYNML